MKKGKRLIAFALSAALVVSSIQMPAMTVFAQSDEQSVSEEVSAPSSDATAGEDTTDSQKETVSVVEGQDFKVEYGEDGMPTKNFVFSPEEDGNYVIFTPYGLYKYGYALEIADEKQENPESDGRMNHNGYMIDGYTFEKGKTYTMEFYNPDCEYDTIRIVKEKKPVSASLSIDRNLPDTEKDLYIIPYIKTSVTYEDNSTVELDPSTLLSGGIDSYGNMYEIFSYTDENSWQDGNFSGTVYGPAEAGLKLALGYKNLKNEDYTKLKECEVSLKPIDEADLDTITEGAETIYKNTWYKITAPYTAMLTRDKIYSDDKYIYTYANGTENSKYWETDTKLYKGITYYVYYGNLDDDEAQEDYQTKTEIKFTFNKAEESEIILGQDVEVRHKDDQDNYNPSDAYIFRPEEDGNYVLFTPNGYPQDTDILINVTDVNTDDSVDCDKSYNAAGALFNTYELKKGEIYSIVFYKNDSSESTGETFRMVKENKPVSADIALNRSVPYASGWEKNIYVVPYISLTMTYADCSKKVDITELTDNYCAYIDEYGNAYHLYTSYADGEWNYSDFDGMIDKNTTRLTVGYLDQEKEDYIKLGEGAILHKTITEADMDAVSIGQNTVNGSNWYRFTAPETGYLNVTSSGENSILYSELYEIQDGNPDVIDMTDTVLKKNATYYLWLEFRTEDGEATYDGAVDIQFTGLSALPKLAIGEETVIDINSKTDVRYQFTVPKDTQEILFNLNSDIKFDCMIYNAEGELLQTLYDTSEVQEELEVTGEGAYILVLRADDPDDTENGVQGSATCKIIDREDRFNDLSKLEEGTISIAYGEKDITYKEYVFVPKTNGTYMFNVNTDVFAYTGVEDTLIDTMDSTQGTGDLTMNCYLEKGRHYRFYVEIQSGADNYGTCTVSVAKDLESKRITGLKITGYDEKLYEIDESILSEFSYLIANGLHYEITYDDETTKKVDVTGEYEDNGVQIDMLYQKNKGVLARISDANEEDGASDELLIPFSDLKTVPEIKLEKNEAVVPSNESGQNTYKFKAPVTGYYTLKVDKHSDEAGWFYGGIYNSKNLKKALAFDSEGEKALVQAGDVCYVNLYTYDPTWTITLIGTPEIKKEATCEAAGIKMVPKKITDQYGWNYELAEEEIPALGHVAAASWNVTKATTKAAGKRELKCTKCGKTIKSEVIPKIQSVTLKTAAYTYDGKVKTPAVVVKDANGNAIAAANYTVTGGEGRTNARTYSITVTFKNNYQGSSKLSFTIKKATQSLKVIAAPTTITAGKKATLNVKGAKGAVSYITADKKIATVSKGKVTGKKAGQVVITVKSAATANYNEATADVTIKIKPKTTSISKVTSPKKGQIKVTWKKNTTGGAYEIQYSTSKKFTKKTTKSVTVAKNSTTSKSITKLSKGKKYYVRMRSIDKTGKLASAWSTKKNVTTK